MISTEISELHTKLRMAEGVLRDRERALSDLNHKVSAMTADLEVVTKAELALSEIASRVLSTSTTSVDDLVTLGLRSVFTDCNLAFRSEVGKFKGKTSLKFALIEDGEEAPLMDSYGGGVIAVVGVLLRVMLITMLGLRRVLVLDETLANVSEQYIPEVSRLLKKLSTDLGFEILLVTHQPEFASHADAHYVIQEESGHVNSAVFIKR